MTKICGSQVPLIFSRMRSGGFSFYFRGLGVETCSFEVAFAITTVCNRPQPSASDRSEGPMAVPMASAARGIIVGNLKRRATSFCVAGVALRDISPVRVESRFVRQAQQYFREVFRR